MSADDGFAWAMHYAVAGLLIFPVNANKKPLTTHGFKDATSDPAAIEAWREKWAHCEFGWAAPAGVVVDVDIKHGKNGYADFKRLAGCDPRDVLTPQATTPSGGLQVFYAASKPYKNAVAIDGTGIDTRAEGGYVVLPLPGNGREWLRPLIGADGATEPLLPAPAWLDAALRKAPSPRAPLILAPRSALAPPSSDSWAQKKALAQLARACAKIAAAPCGAQDATRHAQCFYIGGPHRTWRPWLRGSLCGPPRGGARHAGLSRSVARSRIARRPLDRGRHRPPARHFRGRAFDAAIPRPHALQAPGCRSEDMMRRPLDPSKPGRKAAGSTSDDRTQELMAQGHPVEMPPKPERRRRRVAAKPNGEDNPAPEPEPVPDVLLYQEEVASERDAFLNRIADLKALDEQGAREIVADVIKAGLSDFAIETLTKRLAEAFGVTIPLAKKFWKAAAKAAAKEAADAANAELAKLAAEAHARFKQEVSEQQQRQTTDEHDRLRSSCSKIAMSPTLLADMEKFVRKLGLVGEGASLRGAYLTASSRFNEDSAICLLRRGAPAGGKNFLFDRTFVLIPDGDIIRISSGSPMSLVYYGGEDEDAFKHKILYVPEAAIIAEKNKVESPLTIMLRILISEGRLDHNVALPQADGQHETKHIKRNGPVVVVITSARDNVEDEMLTRLMTSDADESAKQTIAVVLNALLTEDRDASEAEIEQWLDFQRWLALEAPYRVAIPFRSAISEAFKEHWERLKQRGENPKIQLRLRRDSHGMLTAIKTSAILHKAQRKKDARGRIVATVDDYRNAHEAFDEGLASLYRLKIPLTALAVVKAIEEMGATEEDSAKVTVSRLMSKLGISGRGATAEPIRDAEDRGCIKLVDKFGGYGPTTAREYTIGRSSKTIEAEIEAGVGLGVFPPADSVDSRTQKEDSPVRYNGTTGTAEESSGTTDTVGERNYTSYTVVPNGWDASDEESLEFEKPKKSANPSDGFEDEL
jgi:hypothetical protein